MGAGGGGGAVSKKNFFDPSGLSLVHLVIQTLRWGRGGSAVSKKNFFDPSGLSLVHLVIQTLRWGRGGGGGGGCGVQKEFFRSFGPQFGTSGHPDP